MAPEQLEGGDITAAVDVYAFGVVLYEMVTSKLPFSGESNFAVALKRLKEPAPTPRTLVPDLDPVWEHAILKCLERAPSERFGSIEEAGSALVLDPQGVGTKPVARRAPKTAIQTKSRAVLLIGAVLMLVLMGALALRFSRGVADQTRARRSVAVLGFRNLTGSADAAWLSTALSEMLTTELSAGEQLRTIPGENIARMKVELPLPESSSFSADTLGKIRGYLGADILISGSYLIENGVPNRVRVDLRLQDSSNGELLATISDQAQPTEILELVSRSGAQLREKLGVNPASTDVEAVHSSQPANLEAARFYAEGLEKLRFFEALQARDLLQKAVTADPRHSLAQAALGTSWAMLGYMTRAKEETRKALDLSAKLSREDRLVVEGKYRETSLEWDQAAEIYRTLFGFFPDNVEYGLRLAAAQTSAGKPKAALATIEALRKFSTLNANDPRIDLAEARAGGALSDFKHERTLAAAAAARARESGARLFLAGARLIEGNAAASTGDLAAARSAFEDARKIYSEVGDRWDAANAATNLAYVLAQSGNQAAAKTIYDESLITYKELGDRRGTAAVYVSRANLFRNQGDLASARSMHEQALAIYREIGDRIGEAKSLNNIANVLASSGDLQSARKMLETALPIFRETGDRNSAATILGNLADLNAESGDLSRAAFLYEQALETFREVDNKSAVAYASSRQGDILLIKGDLDAARTKHEDALALRRQIGEKGAVADSQLALAQIALLQDAPRDAEGPVREALDQFRAEGRKDQEASGMAVLAQSLLAQNRYPEAKEADVRAQELASQSKNGSLRLSVGITTASIRAASGDTLRAANDLERLAGEARRAGLIPLEFEARLAMGKVEAAGGRLVAARNHFASLEQDAARRGYKYIADAAAAAANKIPRASTPRNAL
jgi:tetratricopeptide (TPR) repeat protein